MAVSEPGFEVICPHCSQQAMVRLEDSGNVMGCPHCGMPFRVPLPEGSAAAPPTATQGFGGSGIRFQFQCRRCASLLEGDSSQSGQQGMCPTCGGVFGVPYVDASTGLALGQADPGDDGENPTPMHAYACAGDKAPRIIRVDDQTLLIECARCGGRCPITANTCPKCGVPFTIEGQGVQAVSRGSGKGSTALTLGIVALVLSMCLGPFAGIVGVAAIVMGVLARQEGATHDRGSATAGIVLGIIACAIALIAVAQWL